jgi:hypothetical protein
MANLPISAGASAKPTLPAVGAITKGRPVEWFSNSGTPSVRDCLQGSPGLTAAYDNFISNTAATNAQTAVGGYGNNFYIGAADSGSLVVVKTTLNNNGTLQGTASSNTTIPANILLINGASSLPGFGADFRAVFVLSDNSSSTYVVGANTSLTPPAVGNISGSYTGTRICVCPSSHSSGQRFWTLANTGNMYSVDIGASGTITAQGPAVALNIGTPQGSGQSLQMYYNGNSYGTRDNLWVAVQRTDGALYYCNYAINVDSSGLGTGGQRSNFSVNSSVGAMQSLPVRINSGTANWIYFSQSGSFIINYVDGNTNGSAANISSAYTPPNFPGGFDLSRVKIAAKNYNPHNLPVQSISAGAPIGGGGTNRWVASYTAPNGTVTYYCDFSFDWPTLTWTTNFTSTIGHPEVIDQIETSRPTTVSSTLTDPSCIFIHRSSSGPERIQGVVAGSTSVSSNVFAIADATVTNGQPCPLDFEGDVLTGLSGLTPGAKHYLNTTNGSLTTTNSGVPLYHALDAARAVVKINP